MITTSLSPRATAPQMPAAAPTPSDATFDYNSQDSTVMSSGTTVIHNFDGSGSNPSNDKVQLSTPLAPSAPGQFIFKEGTPEEVAAQSFATVAHTADLFGQA